MDITSPHLQANGFNREVYVRPPRELSAIDDLWKLEAAVDGLLDSGWLWYLTSSETLTSNDGLQHSWLNNTFYYRRGEDGTLEFMLASQVDHYLYAGIPKHMKALKDFLEATFVVNKINRYKLSRMGCDIMRQHNGGIALSRVTKNADCIQKYYEKLLMTV